MLILEPTLRKTEKPSLAARRAGPEESQLYFVVLLDLITGHDPALTDYLLETPTKCPRAVTEKTLIEFECYRV